LPPTTTASRTRVPPPVHADGGGVPLATEASGPPPHARPIADVEAVELLTVGIDVGSSTSHAMFARVRLERLASALSSRYVVSSRESLWRSPVVLTPYRGTALIDAEALSAFLASWGTESGIPLETVDTGAVLLTGTALERANSRAVADAVARDAGRFVCAAAGHHMEAELAAHGSGTVEMSRHTAEPLLNVDVGGGTAKLALVAGGAVVSTAALGLGGRLVAWDAQRRIERVEPSARWFAGDAATDLEIGAFFTEELERHIARRMAEVLVAAICGWAVDEQEDPPWLTEPLAGPPARFVTLSGGVSEYLYGREHRGFGDLGASLARAVDEVWSGRGGAPRRLPAAHGIRATVIGASQFSTQVSGSTVLVPDEADLPAHGLPVLRPVVDLTAPFDRSIVAEAVRRAIERRAESIEDARGFALAFSWAGDPSHARLLALAGGIGDALSGGPASLVSLLVVVIDRDLGESLGRVLRDEVGLSRPVVVCIDGLELGSLDFIDVAARREPSGVVPVVVKSLVFAA